MTAGFRETVQIDGEVDAFDPGGSVAMQARSVVIGSFVVLAACGSTPAQEPSSPKDRCVVDLPAVFAIKQLSDLRASDLDVLGGNTYDVKDDDGVVSTRANCTIALFPTEIRSGIPLREFSARLHLRGWINDDNADIADNIGGLLPIHMVAGTSHVVIRLSDPFPPIASAIYARLSTETTEAAFLAEANSPDAGTLVVVDAVVWVETGPR